MPGWLSFQSFVATVFQIVRLGHLPQSSSPLICSCTWTKPQNQAINHYQTNCKSTLQDRTINPNLHQTLDYLNPNTNVHSPRSARTSFNTSTQSTITLSPLCTNGTSSTNPPPRLASSLNHNFSVVTPSHSSPWRTHGTVRVSLSTAARCSAARWCATRCSAARCSVARCKSSAARAWSPSPKRYPTKEEGRVVDGDGKGDDDSVSVRVSCVRSRFVDLGRTFDGAQPGQADGAGDRA